MRTFYCENMKILNAIIAHKDFYWNDLPVEELKKYLVFILLYLYLHL